MLEVRILAGLALAAAVAGAGWKVSELTSNQKHQAEVQACANGLREEDVSHCPQAIQDALRGLRADPTPIVVQAAREDRQASDRLRADVVALAQQPVTHACSDSPAMRLLRDQLRDEAAAAADLSR